MTTQQVRVIKPTKSANGVSIEIPVRFAETDQMGVVHHSVYAVWLEVGRITWMDAAGYPYTQLAVRGYNFAVTALNIEYRLPIRFGDVVQVATAVESLRSRQVSFVYEITIQNDVELRASGTSQHICVDADGHMTRIPPDVLEMMQAAIVR